MALFYLLEPCALVRMEKAISRSGSHESHLVLANCFLWARQNFNGHFIFILFFSMVGMRKRKKV